MKKEVNKLEGQGRTVRREAVYKKVYWSIQFGFGMKDAGPRAKRHGLLPLRN